MKRIPTVVSIDLTAVQASQEKTHPAFQWTYKSNIKLEKRVFNAAKKIITFSDFSRDSVIRDFEIPETKIETIHSGVDTKFFKEFAHSLRIPGKLFRILFIGGDFKRKGGEDLLQVFLSNFSEKAELHLVTPIAIKTKHPNLHVYNNIKAYTSEWFELYQKANLFVLPTYNDAFATVFMEAMAAGLPVIASNLVQVSEVVSEGKTGFLVTPGDRAELTNRINVLIDNPELCQKMGREGYKIASQKFNIFKNLERLESIFCELISP